MTPESESSIVDEARIQHALGGRAVVFRVPEPGVSGNEVEIALTFGHDLELDWAARLVKPDEQAAAAVAEAEAILRGAIS